MTETSTNDDSLRRWRRWCVFGWVVAGTVILARALRTEAALSREAQAMAAKQLLDMAATRLKLREAEHRTRPPRRIANPSTVVEIEQGVPTR